MDLEAQAARMHAQWNVKACVVGILADSDWEIAKPQFDRSVKKRFFADRKREGLVKADERGFHKTPEGAPPKPTCGNCSPCPVGVAPTACSKSELCDVATGIGICVPRYCNGIPYPTVRSPLPSGEWLCCGDGPDQAWKMVLPGNGRLLTHAQALSPVSNPNGAVRGPRARRPQSQSIRQSGAATQC